MYLNNSEFKNASALLGGGIYLRTLKEGRVTFENLVLHHLYTPLKDSTPSRGGCMYINSGESNLNMRISNVSMEDCSVRAEGGCIYLHTSD